MEYEWDCPKRRSNLEKHLVDFSVIYGFDWDTAVIEFDDRHDEPRWVAIGYIGLRLFTVVYTTRDDMTRIISVRKSDPGEMRYYAQA